MILWRYTITVKDGKRNENGLTKFSAIGANAKFEFKPMSYHLMFMMPEEVSKKIKKLMLHLLLKVFGDEFCLQSLQ